MNLCIKENKNDTIHKSKAPQIKRPDRYYTTNNNSEYQRFYYSSVFGKVNENCV